MYACMYALFATDNHARSSAMYTFYNRSYNVQNQYFAELRQNVCLFIIAVVLQIGSPSLDG